MSETGRVRTCEECGATTPNHRWGKTKAHGEGWYFQRDGRVFCPEHRPHYAPTAPGRALSPKSDQ